MKADHLQKVKRRGVEDPLATQPGDQDPLATQAGAFPRLEKRDIWNYARCRCDFFSLLVDDFLAAWNSKSWICSQRSFGRHCPVTYMHLFCESTLILCLGEGTSKDACDSLRTGIRRVASPCTALNTGFLLTRTSETSSACMRSIFPISHAGHTEECLKWRAFHLLWAALASSGSHRATLRNVWSGLPMSTYSSLTRVFGRQTNIVWGFTSPLFCTKWQSTERVDEMFLVHSKQLSSPGKARWGVSCETSFAPPPGSAVIFLRCIAPSGLQ